MATSAIRATLLILAVSALADRPPCVCTRELNPVCGTDRQTYANPCELDCAKSKHAISDGPDLAVAFDGPCEDIRVLSDNIVSEYVAPMPCICPRMYLPVCGTDDHTYENPCELECAKKHGLSPKGSDLAVAFEGPCGDISLQSVNPEPLPCSCPRIFLPICGTDARTYDNQCKLDCAKNNGLSPKGSALAVAYEGPCEEAPAKEARSQKTPELPAFCPAIWEPVCGNDGRTYDNHCLLNGAKVSGQSNKGNDLAVAHAGPCEETSAGIQLLSNMANEVQPLPKACRCPFLFKPVCGTDSVTYPSECTLGCSRAKGTSTKGADLRVAHAGAC